VRVAGAKARWAVLVVVALACALPARASADPVPTIVLDRDGPVTLLVQSKSAVDILGIDVASPAPAAVCGDCRGGEAAQLGPFSNGTEIVLRLTDGEKTFLSTDPLHARIDKSGGTWRIGWDDAAGDADFQDLVVTIAVPTLPPPIDRDGDGVSPPTDCLDTNSAVHPGAPEIAGNGLDDDCVGGDAPGAVEATVALRWRGTRRDGVRLLRLTVRGAPPGARIELRCRGKRCRFKHRGTHAGRTGTAQLLKRVPHRRLHRATTLDITITAPGMIGKLRRYTVRKRSMTDGRTLCVPPGASRAVKC
jgi:hypothetical protein